MYVLYNIGAKENIRSEETSCEFGTVSETDRKREREAKKWRERERERRRRSSGD